jgi:hypothetical protein
VAAEATVFTLLSGDSPVAALVAARIYPSVRPQESALPCIVYERTETQIIQTLSSEVVLSLATMEVRAISSTMAQADAISNAASTALAVYTHTARVSAYDPEADVFVSVTTHIVRD